MLAWGLGALLIDRWKLGRSQGRVPRLHYAVLADVLGIYLYREHFLEPTLSLRRRLCAVLDVVAGGFRSGWFSLMVEAQAVGFHASGAVGPLESVVFSLMGEGCSIAAFLA